MYTAFAAGARSSSWVCTRWDFNLAAGGQATPKGTPTANPGDRSASNGWRQSTLFAGDQQLGEYGLDHSRDAERGSDTSISKSWSGSFDMVGLCTQKSVKC